MPQVGETLKIFCVLDDGDTTKFIRAELRDDSGTPLAASPVTLTHISGGYYLYTGAPVTMPSVDSVCAHYKVFTDAGFTTPDLTHGDAVDLYERDESFPDVIDCLNEIKDDLTILISTGLIVFPTAIKGVVREDPVLVGTVGSDGEGLRGMIGEDAEIRGHVGSDDSITGIVQNKESISGTVGG